MDEHEALEQRVQALTEKVERLDRIVYRLWKDLKELGGDHIHQSGAREAE
jgi:archaellum component FlaC